MKTRASSDSIEMGERARPSLGEASRLRGAPERRFVAAAASAAWVGRSRTCSRRRLLRVGTRGNSFLRSAKGSARGPAERQPWRLRSPLVSPESFQPLKSAFIPAISLGGGDGTVFKTTPDGTLTTLVAFDGTNGSHPISLLQASDGNLYGSTYGGGLFGLGQAYGLGTLFKMTPQGKLMTLFQFIDFRINNGYASSHSRPARVCQLALSKHPAEFAIV